MGFGTHTPFDMWDCYRYACLFLYSFGQSAKHMQFLLKLESEQPKSKNTKKTVFSQHVNFILFRHGKIFRNCRLVERNINKMQKKRVTIKFNKRQASSKQQPQPRSIKMFLRVNKLQFFHINLIFLLNMSRLCCCCCCSFWRRTAQILKIQIHFYFIPLPMKIQLRFFSIFLLFSENTMAWAFPKYALTIFSLYTLWVSSFEIAWNVYVWRKKNNFHHYFESSWFRGVHPFNHN